jgi:riboflavin synthase
MFTGIVSGLGEVVAVEEVPAGRRMSIDVSTLADGIEVGGSIAIDGVCLTAVDRSDSVLRIDVTAETLERSTLGALQKGDRVNLERPLAPSGLFEGHIVQGHVDGVATLLSASAEGDSQRVVFEGSPGLGRYIVEKGSVAIDGVSLTVTAVEGDVFEVALIPHTLAVTTLGSKDVGDAVNIELDVIAKYVERLVT